MISWRAVGWGPPPQGEEGCGWVLKKVGGWVGFGPGRSASYWTSYYVHFCRCSELSTTGWYMCHSVSVVGTPLLMRRPSFRLRISSTNARWSVQLSLLSLVHFGYFFVNNSNTPHLTTKWWHFGLPGYSIFNQQLANSPCHLVAKRRDEGKRRWWVYLIGLERTCSCEVFSMTLCRGKFVGWSASLGTRPGYRLGSILARPCFWASDAPVISISGIMENLCPYSNPNFQYNLLFSMKPGIFFCNFHQGGGRAIGSGY